MNNVETLLESMRQESERAIKNPTASHGARLAWYWSHIGSLDMARQLDLITEDQRFKLYDEFRELKPHPDTELHFLLSFADESNGFSLEISRRQLRSLWTAYCFHMKLDVDTKPYDLAMLKIWETINKTTADPIHWEDYETFYDFMCADLV